MRFTDSTGFGLGTPAHPYVGWPFRAVTEKTAQKGHSTANNSPPFVFARHCLLAFGLLIVLGGSLVAEEPKPIELTIHPRAIETPALKYRLFPAESELKSGNAVPILLRLPWEQTPWMNQVYPKLQEWEERPLSSPQWANSNGVLPENFYSEMKRAAFRREATWEYPIGETSTPYLILLPDVQGLRGFLGYGLAARIRYHISRGEFEKAREGILVGLANGKHLSQTPFYVNQLVALAIHKNMLKRTDELISQADSPNLYWALSTLPNSLVELDRAASLESTVFATTLPAANDLDRPREPREWRKMASQLIELLSQLGEIPPLERPKEDASVVEQLLHRLNSAGKSQLTRFVQEARADLPKLLKISAEQVAAMSDEEACIRWYVHLRISRDHQTAAVLALPPREAWPRLAQLQTQIKSMNEKLGGRQQDFLYPTSIYVAAWGVKRKVQALRVIEAVRHFAAAHDGRLPKSLDEIQDLSIPLDPLTDLPFEWKVEGQTATLRGPSLPAFVAQLGAGVEVAARVDYRLQVR